MVSNRSSPTATVVPVLVYANVREAVDWLCAAFEFVERLRAAGPDGEISHAQLNVREGSLMLGRKGGVFQPPRSGEVTQYVHITVPDVDAHYEHALKSGARIIKRPIDMPFGVRQYTAEDIGGHWWTFSQNIADVAPEEWGATPAPDHSPSR